MAANQLRAMYARIGFTNGANDNIVDVQGIDSTRELGYLNDDDVVNLCKTIRRPGGHLPNPAFVAGGALPATYDCTCWDYGFAASRDQHAVGLVHYQA